VVGGELAPKHFHQDEAQLFVLRMELGSILVPEALPHHYMIVAHESEHVKSAIPELTDNPLVWGKLDISCSSPNLQSLVTLGLWVEEGVGSVVDQLYDAFRFLASITSASIAAALTVPFR